MGFYDHFFYKDVSKIGLWVVETQNERIFSYIKAHIPIENINLLEIGVGKADFARICRKNGIKYIGIEPNEKQVQKLKEENFNIKCCFVPPIPFEDNSFDMVYCAHILEHMDTFQVVQKFITEIFNKLKPEGYIAIVSPNYLDWHKEFYDDYTHSYVTTPRRVIQLLTNNGFEIIFTISFNGFAFGGKRLILKYLNRLYPWRLLDILFGKYFHKDFFYKVKPTFNENFLIIGQKTKAEK